MTVLEIVGWLWGAAAPWVRHALGWLSGWMHSGGFGGGAAVLVGLLAYQGQARTRRAEAQRHREARWWDQARWAFELAMGDDPRAVMASAQALALMVEEAEGTEAARFAQAVLTEVLEVPVPEEHPEGDDEDDDDKADGQTQTQDREEDEDAR